MTRLGKNHAGEQVPSFLTYSLALYLSLFSRHLFESSSESFSSSDYSLHLYTGVDVVFLHCYRLISFTSPELVPHLTSLYSKDKRSRVSTKRPGCDTKTGMSSSFQGTPRPRSRSSRRSAPWSRAEVLTHPLPLCFGLSLADMHSFPTRFALPQRHGTRPGPAVFPDAARNPDLTAGPW